MTAKVIPFPINAMVTRGHEAPKTEKQAEDAVDEVKKFHIHETLLTISPMIFERLAICGFDFSDINTSEDDVVHGAFLMEAMNSLLHRYYGLYHPFQTVAEHIVVKKEDESDEYTIADQINISFVDSETIIEK